MDPLQLLAALTASAEPASMPSTGGYNATGLGGATAVEPVGVNPAAVPAAEPQGASAAAAPQILARLTPRQPRGGTAGRLMAGIGAKDGGGYTRDPWQAFSNGLSAGMGGVAAYDKTAESSLKDRLQLLNTLMGMERTQRNDVLAQQDKDRNFELNKRRVDIYGRSVDSYGKGGKGGRPRHPLLIEKDIETLLEKKRDALGLNDSLRRWKPGEKEAAQQQLLDYEKKMRAIGSSPATDDDDTEQPQTAPTPPARPAPSTPAPAQPAKPSQDEIVAAARDAIAKGAAKDAVIKAMKERYGFDAGTLLD
jgi:hypothetical protein